MKKKQKLEVMALEKHNKVLRKNLADIPKEELIKREAELDNEIFDLENELVSAQQERYIVRAKIELLGYDELREKKNKQAMERI